MSILGDPLSLTLARVWARVFRDTVATFLPTLTAESPLGFVSIAVDLYSSTVSALRAARSALRKIDRDRTLASRA